VGKRSQDGSLHAEGVQRRLDSVLANKSGERSQVGRQSGVLELSKNVCVLLGQSGKGGESEVDADGGLHAVQGLQVASEYLCDSVGNHHNIMNGRIKACLWRSSPSSPGSSWRTPVSPAPRRSTFGSSPASGCLAKKSVVWKQYHPWGSDGCFFPTNTNVRKIPQEIPCRT
jgi:hypothetical protein